MHYNSQQPPRRGLPAPPCCGFSCGPGPAWRVAGLCSGRLHPPIWRRERDRRRWSFRAHLASVQVSLWAPQGGRARSLPPKSSEHRIPNPFSPLHSPAPHSFPVLIGLPVFPPSNVLINLARSWFRLLVCTDLTGAGTQPGSESGQGRDLPRAGWGRPRLALDAAGCKTGPEPGL